MSNLNSPSSVSMSLLQSRLQSYIPSGSSSPLCDTIGLFMDNILESQWLAMKASINAFIASQNSSLYPEIRVLISLSDGQVVYDSGKGDAGNTYAKAQSKTINENHNSRVSILTALLSNAGTGYEEKYSSSGQKFEAYHAQRMGASSSNALGVVRVSVLNQ